MQSSRARAAARATTQSYSLTPKGPPLSRRVAARVLRGRLAGVPAAAAEAVEIGRQYRLDRGRFDAERLEAERVRRDDVVEFQHLDLIRGQRRVGQQR